MTMKLTTITHVSVDGVMQGLGGQDEDRRGGSSVADGLAALRQRGETFVADVFQRADAFLFSHEPADLRRLLGRDPQIRATPSQRR